MTAANFFTGTAVRLTKQEQPGLLRAVHRIVKHIVIASLFAVAMLGGGEVPILHASQFADAHALAHEQMDHVAPHDHVHDVGTVSDAGHDHPQDPAGTDRGCTHAHAHCCAAAAILTAAATPPAIAVVGVLHRQRNAAAAVRAALQPSPTSSPTLGLIRSTPAGVRSTIGTGNARGRRACAAAKAERAA